MLTIRPRQPQPLIAAPAQRNVVYPLPRHRSSSFHANIPHSNSSTPPTNLPGHTRPGRSKSGTSSHTVGHASSNAMPHTSTPFSQHSAAEYG